jgi:citrate lyase beta subunit
MDAWSAARTSGRGAVVVDGMMIDEPYAAKATQLCAGGRI